MTNSSSVVLTIIIYLAFPLFFAAARKKPITAARYRTYSFLFNLFLHVFLATIGLFSSGGFAIPMVFWTFVGTFLGKKALESNGTLAK